MQNLIIAHLLKKNTFLSPEQGKRLMKSLCEHCENGRGMFSGKEFGRVFDEKISLTPDKK